MKKTTLLCASLILLAGCSDVPRAAFFNRGTPESLLDVSSEIVTVQLDGDQSVDEIMEWLEQDQPTRAELLCYEDDPLCLAAEEVFGLYGVEYDYVSSDENSVHLIYERVLAHDCENRYVDNHINPYNMSHPAFGCSIASNMVQMVTDKQQFTSPGLLDYPDANKLVNQYNFGYINAPADSGAADSSEVEGISLN